MPVEAAENEPRGRQRDSQSETDAEIVEPPVPESNADDRENRRTSDRAGDKSLPHLERFLRNHQTHCG